MIKCPSCGHENVDGTQFCEGCGEETSGATVAAPGAGPAADTPVAASASGTDASMVKCPACENLNPPENVVCEVCGTELRSTAAFDAAGSSFDASAAAPAGIDAPAASGTPATTPFDVAVSAPAVAVSAPAVAVSAPDVAVQQSGVPDAGAALAPPPGSAMPDVTAPPAPDLSAMPSPPVTMPVAPDVAPDIPVAAPPVGTPPMVTPPVSAPPVAPPVGGADLQPGRVKMVVEQGMSVGKQFVLGDPELLVGREDEEEGIYPDIDLSDQDEGYVHRRHATIRFENGQLMVTHLGGANKSRINNRPLPDNQPQPVNLGDKVAFGKVVLRVQTNP